MIDSLLYYRKKAAGSKMLERLAVTPGRFMLVTLHRPSNVDTREGLNRILSVFEQLQRSPAIVFPVHPRTRKMLALHGLESRAKAIQNLILIEPAGYLEFLQLLDNAQLVLTDSGGLQEETTYLGVPCLTMRENTERPITCEVGTNELCGQDVGKIVRKSLEVFDGKPKKGEVPPLWDGQAARRIAGIMMEQI
jgi:UDP-N-acetylglucosamine 2-epimerase (non-hydrolysing)